MATWPDLAEVQASIGNVKAGDVEQVDQCRTAAIDRLTSLCVITLDDDEVPVVPDAVRRACVMLTSRLFHRRNSPDGVAIFGELGGTRVSNVDVDVLDLIAAYRSWGVA